MNKLILLLVAIFATSAFAHLNSAAPELKFLWHTWKQINSKIYSEAEEIHRFGIFVENYLNIIKKNAENNGVKFALNKFADLTKQEWKSQNIRGLLLTEQDKEELRVRQELASSLSVDYSVLSVPDSVDWREKGGVTPVKDQGSCGSCWSFSSTGALEGLNFVKTGKLVPFSEQQLVDCDKVDQGCNGGLMTNAFAYTAKKGIETEEDYPYKAVGQRCKFNAKKAQKVNKSFKNVAANNADALKAALVVQPVAVAIEADEQAFQFYNSGVIKAGCGAQLDHGVLAVGYTKINGEEAFIVKNSWNSNWGDNGYVHISTDKSANNGAGVCGILAMATVPTA